MAIKKKEKICEWTQGYVNAVCCMITLERGVHTVIREMYRAGIGNDSLKTLKLKGVDESDLTTLKKYWKELKK